MKYISPIKFLQRMFSNMNNCKINNTRQLETNMKFLESHSWMYSSQYKGYLALFTEQHFFIACWYETSPWRNLHDHSS